MRIWVKCGKYRLFLLCFQQAAPDAAEVRGRDVQVGGNLLDGQQLQDVGTALQQLEVALFGREAVEVEVAGVDVQEKLLHDDAARALPVHVRFVVCGQSGGGTEVDEAGGNGPDVGFGRQPVEARGIVGDELAGEDETHVVLPPLGTVEGGVAEDAGLHVADACGHLALTQEVFVLGKCDGVALVQAQIAQER